MGFRKHRRHRGGGGGGGGGHHHYSYGTGEANGVQPGDDVGNRRQMKPVHVPPDDLGNRKDPEESEWVPEDSVGNRIEASPTHELSGVLIDLDGRRRRRRPKGVSAPERVGRFLVGGVNPLIAANVPRPYPGKTLEESLGGPPPRPQGDEGRAHFDDGGGAASDHGAANDNGAPGDGGRRERGERGGRRDRGGDGLQDISERRTNRFFDFEEDDRFEYTLKTPAEQKRADAEACVKDIVMQAGRDATVLARLIEDGTRPKVLVTVEERGPASTLPPERRSAHANDPLFVMGNGALMSLNYLVNKIVNRYPDDRIRLAILPAADERLYVDSLAEHRKLKPLPVKGQASSEQPAPVVPAAVVPAIVEAAPVETAPVETAPVEAAPVETAPAEEAPAEKVKPARKSRAAREEPAETPRKAAREEEAPKRPVRRAVKKAPAVEVVVKAPRSKA